MCATATSKALAASLTIPNRNMTNYPNTADDAAHPRTVLNYASPTKPINLLVMSETETGSVRHTVAVFSSVFGGSYLSAIVPSDGRGNVSFKNLFTAIPTAIWTTGSTCRLRTDSCSMAAA